MVVLDAEFNFLSNGMTFNNDHRSKIGSYDEKLGFSSSFYGDRSIRRTSIRRNQFVAMYLLQLISRNLFVATFI